MAKGIVLFLFVALAMIQFMVKPGQAAVTCGQVDSSLAPCISYLTSGGTPTSVCCDGVKNIKAISATTADKRAACKCVKEAAARNQNIKDDNAAALPTKCNVEMSIPISRNTNCDIIKA